VTARFPELPDLLRRLEKVQAAMRLKEAEVARALAESGGERVGVRRSESAADGALSEHTLQDRRVMLVAEMRDALETTQSRRATIAAALENVRVQLLRIGAGVGTPDDMHEEIAALRTLASLKS